MIHVSIRNLKKSFGNTYALNGINLDITPGELFFLLGPSGCGKTTLLRSIAGFYEPDAGSIHFNHKDVTHVPAHKRNTAMMFQSYALWPHMNVAHNVAFGLEERKLPKPEIEERVLEALRIVRMQDLATRKIHELSGGQQQRVALARSLVVRPQCLLLDEPLSNLDAALRMDMRNEIRRICKEFEFTAIYVTHDQKEAIAVADRMAIIEHGQVAQVGTPKEIYRRPVSSSVASFIGETNFLTGYIEYTYGDTALVSTPGADFEGRISEPGWTPERGEQATVAIRPEALVLRDDPSFKNTLPVNVTSSMYLGETAQYQLRSKSGDIIRVSELNPHQLRTASQEFLYAHAEPNDVVILRNRSVQPHPPTSAS